MKTRRFGPYPIGRSLFPLGLCALMLLALAACQTEEPPEPQTLLRLKLNDTLGRYERVLVEVFARDDSSRAIDTLWNDKLAPATRIPAYDLKKLRGNEFIVKVTAYASGSRLALRTRIYYSQVNGVFVLHETVPPLLPQNWLVSLKPSVGTLSPEFSQDSLFYLLKLPQAVDSISFVPKAPNPFISIQANGQTVQYGKPTKTYKIGGSPDTVWIRVTDTGTGTAATRDYRIAVIPTPPPGLLLASLVPSTGQLGIQFTPDNNLYFLYMPPSVDTISFRASPIDPQTMNMTIDNRGVLPDQQSQVITVAPGTLYTVEIYVMKDGKKAYYQVILDHTQKSSH
jgi:Cadherin-like beta sandwich domain